MRVISYHGAKFSNTKRGHSAIKHREIVQLTAPLNEITGMPDPKFFKVRTLQEITDFLKQYPACSSIVTFMAQPICVAVIATDNKYRASHIAKQWTTIANKLEELHIKVEGFGCGGDEKQIAAQKAFVNFGTEYEFHGLTLIANPFNEYGVLQDPWHILNKMRMRLYDGGINLQLGHKVATVGHLQRLLLTIR